MATKRTATLTRQGALAVTTDMDKLATLFQHNAEILGVPTHIASDFAYRLDLLSDHVEKHAIRMAAEAGEPESEPEAEVAKAAAESEPEVKEEEPKADVAKEAAAKKADFDAGSIAKTVSGPLEEIPPKEPAVSGHFKQDKFHELHDKQVGGGLGKSAKLAAFDVLASAFKSVFAGESEAEEAAESPAEEAKEQAKQAGCEKLPEGGMRDNCEAKKAEGAESDKKDDPKKEASKTASKTAGYNLFA